MEPVDDIVDIESSTGYSESNDSEEFGPRENIEAGSEHYADHAAPDGEEPVNKSSEVSVVESLMNDMKSNDFAEKPEVVMFIGEMSRVMGEKDTNTRLIPLLIDIVRRENEEALLIITMYALVLHDGKPEWNQRSAKLMELYETLCSVEDKVVRENTAELITNLFLSKPIEVQIEHEGKLIEKLLKKPNWFTTKLAAAAILPRYVERVGWSSFVHECAMKLLTDTTALVKRNGSMLLALILPMADLGKCFQETLQMIDIVCNEKNDTIRMEAPKLLYSFLDTVTLYKKKNEFSEEYVHEATEFFWTHILKCFSDSSWKVRASMGSEYYKLIQIEMDQKKKEEIHEAIGKLIKDSEVHVRIGTVCGIKNLSMIQDKTELLYVIEKYVIKIVEDSSTEVRRILAESLPTIVKALGLEKAKLLLVPVVHWLLEDNSIDVRLNIVKNIEDLCVALEHEMVSGPLIPVLNEISQARNWRSRSLVVEKLPKLQMYITDNELNETVETIVLKLLSDQVAEVRSVTINTIRDLTVVKGEGWFFAKIYQALCKHLKTPKYHQRCTALFLISAVADHVTLDFLLTVLFPQVISYQDDPTPNVRHIVVNFLLYLKKIVCPDNNDFYKSHIYPVLIKFRSDPDPCVSEAIPDVL